jgi:DNA-binding response OmpR family regulator
MNLSPCAKILCVDEDPYFCEWIKRSLRSARIPADISFVTSGREAFSRVSDESFDLCILEYPLSDMTGAQLCTLLRYAGHSVPVMFLSALSRPIDREKAMASGAEDYLCKEDDLDIFVSSVERLLSKGMAVYAPPQYYLEMPRAA